MMKRVIYIDRIKGIAILLMVLAHVYKFPLQMSDNLLYKFIGSFHMHLFMFISGFVAFIPALKINGGAFMISGRKDFLDIFVRYDDWLAIDGIPVFGFS